MEPLIDLSTPKPVPVTYSSDFTPTLSRALGECFKRRKQSLLPVAKENELSVIQEKQSSTNTSSVNMSMGFSPADKLATLDTPQNTLSGPGIWIEDSSATFNMETSTPQKSTKVTKKRPPTTPLTPSLLKETFKKKRALNDKDANRVSCSSPSKLSLWKETDTHQTPESVVEMRRLLHEPNPVINMEEMKSGSCEDKALHHDPLDDALYSKWLTEQQLYELQNLVEFMELERRYSL